MESEWHHGTFNECISAKYIFMLKNIFFQIELQLTLVDIKIVVRCKSEIVF